MGFEILKNLFRTLTKREGIPYAITLWNKAVKLLKEGSLLVPHLKDLEKKVKILAGKLCVDEFRISGRLALGKLVEMDEILDLILHHEVLTL